MKGVKGAWGEGQESRQTLDNPTLAPVLNVYFLTERSEPHQELGPLCWQEIFAAFNYELCTNEVITDVDAFHKWPINYYVMLTSDLYWFGLG